MHDGVPGAARSLRGTAKGAARRGAVGLRAGLAAPDQRRQEHPARLPQLQQSRRLLRLRRDATRAFGVTLAFAQRSLQQEERMKRMHRFSGVAALIAAGFCGALATPALAQSAAGLAFQNTVKGPPPGWTGPVFKLSHDYPATVPSECPECTCLKLDVDFRPKFPPPADN